LNKNKSWLKNWLSKPRRTPCLAFLPDFSAIVGGFPSKYATIPSKGGFLRVVECGNALRCKNRRLNRIFRLRILGNPRLDSGVIGLGTWQIAKLKGLKTC